MKTEQEHRSEERKGCGCGTDDATTDGAQPLEVQTERHERHERHSTEAVQKDVPSQSKGCCCGS